MMLKIKKSETADTRSCDFKSVTEEQLYLSSIQHIGDVLQALSFFVEKICQRGLEHDYTKRLSIKEFHADFLTGFERHAWWDMHKATERHHLAPECVGDTVNLVDILEHICDCVMAGKARTGTAYPITIPAETLLKAVENTQKMLEVQIEVVD